jgi:hypothetical protein
MSEGTIFFRGSAFVAKNADQGKITQVWDMVFFFKLAESSIGAVHQTSKMCNG